MQIGDARKFVNAAQHEIKRLYITRFLMTQHAGEEQRLRILRISGKYYIVNVLGAFTIATRVRILRQVHRVLRRHHARRRAINGRHGKQIIFSKRHSGAHATIFGLTPAAACTRFIAIWLCHEKI